MKTQQLALRSAAGAGDALAPLAAIKPQLVTVFGAVSFFTDKAFQDSLRAALPDATSSAARPPARSATAASRTAPAYSRP
jgi:hypothetical protein